MSEAVKGELQHDPDSRGFVSVTNRCSAAAGTPVAVALLLEAARADGVVA